MGLAKATASGRTTVAHMKSIPTDDDAFGKGSIRADGAGMFPPYLFEVKTKAESKYPWDYDKPMQTTPASVAVHPLGSSCHVPVPA
jgi:branched-chain amino acid transport system substrate-binding protein